MSHFFVRTLIIFPRSLQLQSIILRTYDVKLNINYFSPYIFFVDLTTPQDSDQATIKEDEEEFWLGSICHRNNSSFGGPQPPAPATSLPERGNPRHQGNLSSLTYINDYLLACHSYRKSTRFLSSLDFPCLFNDLPSKGIPIFIEGCKILNPLCRLWKS